MKKLTALSVAREKVPGKYHDGNGLYLLVDGPSAKRWGFRYVLNHKERWMGLGSTKLVSLQEAREKCREAHRQLHQGADPIEYRKTNIELHKEHHERIARKALLFIEKNIEPICYLYRHYHPSGELLYVGISLNLARRQKTHLKNSDWRLMISQITIEPFETREQALAAEEDAIRNEFPKFNMIHNSERHPIRVHGVNAASMSGFVDVSTSESTSNLGL